MPARSERRYFNPRSREGSDRPYAWRPCLDGISIHAPVKGATLARIPKHGQPAISIHAPVKGATIDSTQIQPSPQFQSTLP